MKTLLSPLATLALTLLFASCSGTNTAPSAPVGSQGVDYRNSKAEVVVLNFFDMYCPQCQKEAKYVNELYTKTRQQGLGSRINFYAIGWNNTPLEAEMYRKRFGVSYPVISDRDRSISHRFNTIKPPLLIALRKQGGQWKEFYRTKGVRGKTASIITKIQP